MTDYQISQICCGMAVMASKYPNDTIANALARVSWKLESYRTTKFAPELTDLDRKIIKFYLANK